MFKESVFFIGFNSHVELNVDPNEGYTFHYSRLSTEESAESQYRGMGFFCKSSLYAAA